MKFVKKTKDQRPANSLAQAQPYHDFMFSCQKMMFSIELEGF
jgi:hypothetical protein